MACPENISWLRSWSLIGLNLEEVCNVPEACAVFLSTNTAVWLLLSMRLMPGISRQ